MAHGASYGVAERFRYTPAGLVTSKSQNRGTLYRNPATVDYVYDNEGKVIYMWYPQAATSNGTTPTLLPRIGLHYGYDAAGRLEKISRIGNPDLDLITSAQYGAAGQLTSLTRAADVVVDNNDVPLYVAWSGTETLTYNGLGQMTRQAYLGTDIEYRFSATANDGRLTQKKDWVSGEEVSYQYDQLGRLTSAATTGPEWGLSWTYDGFGNRLQQNVTKGTGISVQMTVNPATNRLTGAFTYDANGNQTAWTTPLGDVTVGYDMENRAYQVTTPTGSQINLYNSSNLRLFTQAPGAETGGATQAVYGLGGELLGEYSECMGDQVTMQGPGGTPSRFGPLCDARIRVHFAGRLVLKGRAGGDFGGRWYAMRPDRLGTPSTERTYPYGDKLTAPAEAESFTTYTRDGGTGLDYAKNRYYSSTWGRFTSADPYQGSGRPAHPKSWNRYAYVNGDPVNYSDPSGLNLEFYDGNCPAEFGFSDCGANGGGGGGYDDMGGGGIGNGCMADYMLAGLLPDANCLAAAAAATKNATPPSPHCKDPKVEGWITAHGEDAAAIAARLSLQGTTGEADILALSAVESGWGSFQYKDPKTGQMLPAFPGAWFGMHGPLPGQATCARITGGRGCVAEFSSFLDAAAAFAGSWQGQLVKGITDPTQFFSMLQTKGKFGWKATGPGTGYVEVMKGVEAAISDCLTILNQ